jgi:thiopurine S-methyltransferase
MSHDRDNPLWLQLWNDSDIEFHQLTVNTLLIKYWPLFDAKFGSRVFIPLCGKSLDMIWLAEQGHHVIGIELSPIAVEAFFIENGLTPHKQQQKHYTLWQYQRITILCGDFFSLNAEDIGEIDSVYDRAALTALPEDLRQPYVDHMQTLIPNSCNMFLLTVEDIEQSTVTTAIDAEISSLYGDHYRIELACVENAMGLKPTLKNVMHDTEYKLYELSHK